MLSVYMSKLSYLLQLAECNLKESNAPTTTQKAERPSRTLTRTAGKTARLNSG